MLYGSLKNGITWLYTQCRIDPSLGNWIRNNPNKNWFTDVIEVCWVNKKYLIDSFNSLYRFSISMMNYKCGLNFIRTILNIWLKIPFHELLQQGCEY